LAYRSCPAVPPPSPVTRRGCLRGGCGPQEPSAVPCGRCRVPVSVCGSPGRWLSPPQRGGGVEGVRTVAAQCQPRWGCRGRD
ncbi:MAG: hypothetical protein ACK56I_23650, partial [bacterium]